MVTNGNLYTNVMEKLKFEPSIDESNITIGIKDDGIVILGGKVRSFYEKHLAEKAAEKVKEVKGVANEIEVELVSTSKRSDVEIVKVALDTLKSRVLVPSEQVKVVVENGCLTITGEVEYKYQKELAERAVSSLYGVRYVSNEIVIRTTVKPENVKAKIIKEYERNARIDANNINVVVDGGTVTLKGKVRNIDEYNEARNAAWSVPGVNKVVDNLQISS